MLLIVELCGLAHGFKLVYDSLLRCVQSVQFIHCIESSVDDIGIVWFVAHAADREIMARNRHIDAPTMLRVCEKPSTHAGIGCKLLREFERKLPIAWNGILLHRFMFAPLKNNKIIGFSSKGRELHFDGLRIGLYHHQQHQN